MQFGLIEGIHTPCDIAEESGEMLRASREDGYSRVFQRDFVLPLQQQPYRTVHTLKRL
jgi:hypothetical protein